MPTVPPSSGKMAQLLPSRTGSAPPVAPECRLCPPPSLHCTHFPLSYPRARTLNFLVFPLLSLLLVPEQSLVGAWGTCELNYPYIIHLQIGKLPSLLLQGFCEDRRVRACGGLRMCSMAFEFIITVAPESLVKDIQADIGGGRP